MASVMDSKDLEVSSYNSDDGSAVVIAVRDCGRGSTAQDLPKMFDAFFTTQANRPASISRGRSIVEAHGGRIWAENNHSTGLTVQFSLPLRMQGISS